VSIQEQSPEPALLAFESLRPCVASKPASILDAKRIVDIAVSLTAIVLLLPIFALVTLLVALESRGPVLFCQRRIGRGGKPFGILKFRSMKVLEDGADVVQAVQNDPRITRLGRFLRVSSLDELPQLFNVLWGEMSLVGPRPHAVAHDEYYGARINGYALRYIAKPGITGWAQVNGARGETRELSDMQRRINFDAWYVEHASMALDLLILARTPLEVVRRRNAY
jgi:putative colanic acid biosysnthesis UDP-glucose lipid carrier transferase